MVTWHATCCSSCRSCPGARADLAPAPTLFCYDAEGSPPISPTSLDAGAPRADGNSDRRGRGSRAEHQKAERGGGALTRQAAAAGISAPLPARNGSGGTFGSQNDIDGILDAFRGRKSDFVGKDVVKRRGKTNRLVASNGFQSSPCGEDDESSREVCRWKPLDTRRRETMRDHGNPKPMPTIRPSRGTARIARR